MFLKKGLFYLHRTLTNWKDIFHPLTLQMTAMAGAKPGQSQESEAPCISIILGAESHSRFTIKELDQMWSSRDMNYSSHGILVFADGGLACRAIMPAPHHPPSPPCASITHIPAGTQCPRCLGTRLSAPDMGSCYLPLPRGQSRSPPEKEPAERQLWR